jgi:tripartite-type tricarboxylate transporter receptor subunit TctC
MQMRKTNSAALKPTRRAMMTVVLSGAAASVIGTPTAAIASGWPSRPVRVVTFGPAGSAPDLAVRIWSEALSRAWKQPVVIDNRPGGDGIIAVQAMLAAKDEHTLFFGPLFIYSVLHNTNPTIAFRPRDEMLPICATNLDFISIAVSPKVPATTLAELREYARSKPGALTWWAPSGSTLWLLMQDFISTANLNMLYVPYSGAPKAAADLVEDRLHVAMIPLAVVIGLVEAGRAKLVATAGTQRPPAAPGTATAREQGFPDLTNDGVFGFYGPKTMPSERIAQISRAVIEASAEHGFDARFRRLGQSLRPLPTSQFISELAAYEERFAKLAIKHKPQ